MKRLLVILLVILLGMVVLGKTVTIEFWTLSLSPTFDD